MRFKSHKTYLLARGYNNNFLEKQFLRAANISRTNALQIKPKASNDVVPFIVTYNPALPPISNILRKHVNILSYTLLTVAKTSLSNRLLLLTEVALIFVTF